MVAPTVREVMSRTACAVRDKAAYGEMIDALVTHDVGTLALVDAAGLVVGVVSDADLLAAIARGEDIDATPVPGYRTDGGIRVTIAPDASVVSAMRLMGAARVERLPVVDDHGTLLGTVSRRQVLRAALPPLPSVRDELAGPLLRRVLARRAPRVRAETAGGVVTLTGTTDLRSTARMVLELAGSVPGVVEVVDHLTHTYDDTTQPYRRSTATG